MRKLAVLIAFASIVFAQPAAASSVGEVRNFGPDLSTMCNLPEGIAADDHGRIYASSLNLNATSGPANICVLNRGGRVVDLISVAPGSAGVAKLLGMLYVPGEGLYVGDIARGRVRIDVRTHSALWWQRASSHRTPSRATAREISGLRLVRGSITRIEPNGTRTTYSTLRSSLRCPARNPRSARTAWPSMRPAVPVRGVTARDQVFARIHTERSERYRSRRARPVGRSMAGRIAFDSAGNLYVASNQSDRIAVLSPRGTVFAQYAARVKRDDSPASWYYREARLRQRSRLLHGGAGQKVSTFKRSRAARHGPGRARGR